MERARYRCLDCGASIPAEEVEQTRWVWPEGVDKNASGHGMIEIQTRPASVICNGHHKKPGIKQMRREQVRQ